MVLPYGLFRQLFGLFVFLERQQRAYVVLVHQPELLRVVYELIVEGFGFFKVSFLEVLIGQGYLAGLLGYGRAGKQAAYQP